MSEAYLFGSPPLTTKLAKRLTKRKDRPYAIIMDECGVEWLVNSVLDNGRIMNLFECDCDGRITKTITCEDYKKYEVMLDDHDIDRMIAENVGVQPHD